MTTPPHRLALMLVGLTTAALALAGCAGSGPRASNAPTASASPTRTAPATTSPTTKPTPAASPSAPPAASWTPVSVACSSVLTAQQVYGYNPNYVANGAYTPAAGSSAATMKSNHGVACGWINETSGSPIAISIAQPDATTLGGLKKTAASGGAAMALNNGAAGYFAANGGVGTAQVFTTTLWIAISSPDFAAPGDVTTLANAVVGDLAGH